MSWERVRAWRDRLADVDAGGFRTGLSPEGAREAWSASLGALGDEALAALADLPGEPWAHACIVAARGAFTAPLEWCAALLGRGSAVRLKHPRDWPGAAPVLAEAAAAVGLPLAVGDERGLVDGADLVVAMGSDETIAALRSSLPADTAFAGFGHRFSAAWLTRIPSVDALASDLALYDSRGCLTPARILTPLPLDELGPALARAMEAAEARWPRGELLPEEGAQLRLRRAIARATGRVWEGPGWAVWSLPEERFAPAGLPRVAMVHSVRSAEEAGRMLAPWADHLSTIGTDDPGAPWGPPIRVCEIGRMQRPELDRLHDGERWVLRTMRRPG